MRVLPCYSGGSGRAEPPQRYSPNGMVNRVRNLPYGGSSGVLGGGVREVLGATGGPGGDRGGPREVFG